MELVAQNTCLECSKHQDTCCFHVNVPLTLEDIQKIESKGFKKKEFIILGEYDKEDFLGEEKWWEDSIISSRGKFFRINVAHDSKGKCFFLREKEGCILGKDRPAVCHIFPFWVEEKSGKVGFEPPANKFCHMEKKEIPVKLALKCMDETEESIKYYFNSMREDCLKNKTEHYKILKELFPESFD